MNTEHVAALLEDYVLGTLDLELRSGVAAHVALCTACAAEMAVVEAGVNALSAAMPSVAHVKRRLDTELAGARRFAHFHSQLQKLFDLPPEAIDALLARSEQADAWEGGLAEGVSLLTVEAGPGCEGCMTALVRLEPGAQFPDHEHGGRERVLVLEGGYRDSTGIEVWRGEIDVREAGTSHSFSALPDGPCICASVLGMTEA